MMGRRWPGRFFRGSHDRLEIFFWLVAHFLQFLQKFLLTLPSLWPDSLFVTLITLFCAADGWNWSLLYWIALTKTIDYIIELFTIFCRLGATKKSSETTGSLDQRRKCVLFFYSDLKLFWFLLQPLFSEWKWISESSGAHTHIQTPHGVPGLSSLFSLVYTTTIISQSICRPVILLVYFTFSILSKAHTHTPPIGTEMTQKSTSELRTKIKS